MIEILLMIYIIDINSKIEIRVVDVAAVGLPVKSFVLFFADGHGDVARIENSYNEFIALIIDFLKYQVTFISSHYVLFL